MIMKNLKEDILAAGRSSCSQGHFVASTIIETLCDQKTNKISSIVGILKTRSASKPRDMMTVAGLLASNTLAQMTKETLVDLPANITQTLLLSMKWIESAFLFHGHVTMAQQGAFSWCPLTCCAAPICIPTAHGNRALMSARLAPSSPVSTSVFSDKRTIRDCGPPVSTGRSIARFWPR